MTSATSLKRTAKTVADTAASGEARSALLSGM
jgi:hypothetical protein